MKISKTLLKILVVLIFAIALLIPSTFSWYNHNGSLTGNSMSYQRDDLPVSAGTVSAVTKKFYMENEKKQGGSVNNVYYDQKGNKEYKDGEITTDSVLGESSQYYGTTFSNVDSAPAYVNLYLSNFTNSTNAFIGTLQPSLTHKSISSAINLKNKSSIRVYFSKGNVSAGWGASGAKIYAVGITANGTKTGSEMSSDTVTISNNEYYYADVVDNAVSFYFATDGGDSTNNVVTSDNLRSWYRTNTITDIQPERRYTLNGKADDTTFHAQYDFDDAVGGVSVMTYFDTVTINQSQHAYITLTQGTNYTGASVSYGIVDGDSIVSSLNGITVNANTGLITADSSLNISNTEIVTIRTTITSSFGDKKTVDTKVYNPQTISSATVALNVEVPGGTPAEPGTAEVVWYIRNTGTSEVEFKNVYYTK